MMNHPGYFDGSSWGGLPALRFLSPSHGPSLATMLGYNRPRLLVGGVDLSGVDLRAPFWVDFSPRDRSVRSVSQALARLRAAFNALRAWQPDWWLSPDVDVSAARLILSVVPIDLGSSVPGSGPDVTQDIDPQLELNLSSGR